MAEIETLHKNAVIKYINTWREVMVGVIEADSEVATWMEANKELISSLKEVDQGMSGFADLCTSSDSGQWTLALCQASDILDYVAGSIHQDASALELRAKRSALENLHPNLSEVIGLNFSVKLLRLNSLEVFSTDSAWYVAMTKKLTENLAPKIAPLIDAWTTALGADISKVCIATGPMEQV